MIPFPRILRFMVRSRQSHYRFDIVNLRIVDPSGEVGGDVT